VYPFILIIQSAEQLSGNKCPEDTPPNPLNTTFDYNSCVFSLDFGQYNPEGKEADLYCRIITSPKYAKVLCNILQESLEEYEKNHEIINDED
jgi:hypothetical protein